MSAPPVPPLAVAVAGAAAPAPVLPPPPLPPPPPAATAVAMDDAADKATAATIGSSPRRDPLTAEADTYDSLIFFLQSESRSQYARHFGTATVTAAAASPSASSRSAKEANPNWSGAITFGGWKGRHHLVISGYERISDRSAQLIVNEIVGIADGTTNPLLPPTQHAAQPHLLPPRDLSRALSWLPASPTTPTPASATAASATPSLASAASNWWHLTLRNNHFTDDAVRVLCTALAPAGLCTLELIDNEISERAMIDSLAPFLCAQSQPQHPSTLTRFQYDAIASSRPDALLALLAALECNHTLTDIEVHSSCVNMYWDHSDILTIDTQLKRWVQRLPVAPTNPHTAPPQRIIHCSGSGSGSAGDGADFKSAPDCLAAVVAAPLPALNRIVVHSSVNFSPSHFVFDSFLPSLLTGNGVSSLLTLDFHETRLSDPDLEAITNYVSDERCECLTLRMDACDTFVMDNPSGGTWKLCFAIGHNNRSLRTLSMAGCSFVDEDAVLGSALFTPGSNHLTCIDLSDNALCANSIRSIVSALVPSAGMVAVATSSAPSSPPLTPPARSPTAAAAAAGTGARSGGSSGSRSATPFSSPSPATVLVPAPASKLESLFLHKQLNSSPIPRGRGFDALIAANLPLLTSLSYDMNYDPNGYSITALGEVNRTLTSWDVSASRSGFGPDLKRKLVAALTDPLRPQRTLRHLCFSDTDVPGHSEPDPNVSEWANNRTVCTIRAEIFGSGFLPSTRAVLQRNRMIQSAGDINWARVAMIIAFIRANSTHRLRHSVLPLVSSVIRLAFEPLPALT